MTVFRQPSETSEAIARPVLLALPGLDGTGRFFGDFARALGNALEFHAVSYPDDRPLGYPELISIAGAALPDRRPFLLLGESFSGPIALALAAARPSGLCGVVLCASFACNPLPWLRPMTPCVRRIPVHAVPASALSWCLLGRWSTPSLLSAIRNTLRDIAPAVISARIHSVLDCDMSPLLGRIDVPLLYLRARCDRLIRAHASRLLLHHRPDMAIASIDGPHLLLQTVSGPAVAAILDFMNRLGMVSTPQASQRCGTGFSSNPSESP